MRVVSETHHLTQATYDRLTAELEELTTHGRTEIARKIQAARELGDLSENGDYHAAKEEQGKMEGRIAHLAKVLKDVEIVDEVAGDSVEAGCIVGIVFDGDDEVERYLVGSIEERNEKYDVLSMNSPLRQQVLGKGPGDTVTYQGPKREISVTVVAVRPPD